MKSKKILITGGAGFIGTHLIKALVNQKFSTAVIDDLSTGHKNRLPKSVEFFKADIANPQILTIFKKIKPEIVFHLAANSRITSSQTDNINSNLIGTFNVLNCSQAVKIKQLIFTSSSATYGESKTFPIKETHPTKPISTYGISKLTGELYCQLFKPYFSSTIFRLANVYGPYQDSSAEGGVVAIFINKLLKNQLPTIFGTGQQVRDFIYVKDVVSALLKSLQHPQPAVLNLSTNHPTSINQLLTLITKLLNQPSQFKKAKARLGDISKSLLDISKTKKHLHWQPQTSLEIGLKHTIEYFQSL